MTIDELLADLPDLEAEDMAEALRYAAETGHERAVPIRQPVDGAHVMFPWAPQTSDGPLAPTC